MSLFESPAESPVAEDFGPSRPFDASNPRRRSPRRADTLPVRFDESTTRDRDIETVNEPMLVYRERERPSRRPTYDRVPDPRQTRTPTSRYQAYLEPEEDVYINRGQASNMRDGTFVGLGGERSNPFTSYDGPGPFATQQFPRTVSPHYGYAQSPYAVDDRIERGRGPRSIGRGDFERGRERSNSPIRTYTKIRTDPYIPKSRSPSPYRSRPSGPSRYRSRSRSRSQSRSRSRPRSRTTGYGAVRRSRKSRLDQEESIEGYPPQGPEQDNVDSNAYSFTLSRHTNSLLGSDRGLGSISDSSEKAESNEPEIVGKTSTQGKVRHIFKSQYVGDGLIGGHHALKMTEVAESGSQGHKRMPTVFRWIHFEDIDMDFDQFQSNATSIAGLTEAERDSMTKLLNRVKKRYDKPMQTSRGVKSRYMAPSYLQDNIAIESRPKTSSKTRPISWMCVPYFVLESYSVPKSTPRRSAHPMRTLLQARFSLVQQERDMQQAVRLLPDAAADKCFHIAQVWFVILDDSLLISCSRQSMSSLQGDIISFTPKVNVENVAVPIRNILVSSRTSLWSLPLSECQDWFAFVSHFLVYWPRSFQFTYHEKSITADDWPRILSLANRSNIRLQLEFRSTIKELAKGILVETPLEEELDSPPHDNAGVSSKGVAGFPTPGLQVGGRPGASNRSEDITKVGFTVFTWLNTSDKYTKGGVSITRPETQDGGIDQDLREIDDFLSNKTNLNDRLVYRGCPTKKKNDIYKFILEEKRALTDEDTDNTIRLKQYETRVDIINAANSLFQFFLPPDSKLATVDKFWGALSKVVEMPTDVYTQSTNRRQFNFARDASDVLDWLKILTHIMIPFRDLVSEAQGIDRANIQIPDELAKAYLHLLMSLASTASDMQVFDKHMTLCSELLELGLRKSVQTMSPHQLSEYATFLPSELASLVTFQLVQDVTGAAMDIGETYSEYMKDLQAKVETNPLDRGHQDRIIFLKQEISVISEILEQQQRVISLAQVSSTHLRSHVKDGEVDIHGMSQFTRQRPQETVRYEVTYETTPYRPALPTFLTPSPRISGLDPGGVQGLLAQDAIAIIDGRARDFKEMREQASDLGSWNIQRIDSNKDRQEAAVYAFTVVTIIFLPLSTVAGILGMNTNDVRNMTVNQWVFWATALPLTVIIVTLCLIWAGELNNFWDGFSKLWRKKQAYTVIPERYASRTRDEFEQEVIIRNSPAVRERYSAPRVRRTRTLYGGRDTYV